jgi:hypothetical protein
MPQAPDVFRPQRAAQVLPEERDGGAIGLSGSSATMSIGGYSIRELTKRKPPVSTPTFRRFPASLLRSI